MVKKLCRAIRRYPNITAAADACQVNPRQLQSWVKKGLFPNPDPMYAALAQAARRSLGLVKGKLFQCLLTAAETDPKWAAYLMEQMKEEGEIPWTATVPDEHDMPAVRQHLFRNPSPQLIQDIAAAGMKLVPLTESDKALPPAPQDGELVDE